MTAQSVRQPAEPCQAPSWTTARRRERSYWWLLHSFPFISLIVISLFNSFWIFFFHCFTHTDPWMLPLLPLFYCNPVTMEEHILHLISSQYQIAKYYFFSCRIPPSWRTCGRKSATTTLGWSSRTTGIGWGPTQTALWERSLSIGCWEMAPSPPGIMPLDKCVSILKDDFWKVWHFRKLLASSFTFVVLLFSL